MNKILTKSNIFLILEIIFILGILVGNYIYYNTLYIWIAIVLFIITCIILLIFKKYKIFFIFISLSILLLGMQYFSYYNHKIKENISLPYNQEVVLEGVVIDYPDIREDKVKYTIKLTNINFKDNIIVTNYPKILIDYDKYPNYEYGDKLKIRGLLEKPQNWDSFDYEKYLLRYQIFGIVKQNRFKDYQTEISLIGQEDPNVFYKFIFDIKSNFESAINRLLSEPYSGLLNGILVGSKKSINNDLLQTLILVGISHMVVVSGYHATVLTKIFERLTIHWNKKVAFIVGSIFLFALVIFSGITASVIRAVIMAWLFLLARILGRKGNITKLFVFTCFLMIIQNPLIIIYDFGFQLSALSVLGLIYITPYFEKVFKRFGELINITLSATLGAQIMTLPLLVYEFGRLSIISPVINILVVPLTPFIMAFGFLGTFLSFVNFWLGEVIMWPVYLILKYIIWISEVLAKIPYANIEIYIFNKWYYVLIVYIFIMIVIFNKQIKLFINAKRTSN